MVVTSYAVPTGTVRGTAASEPTRAPSWWQRRRWTVLRALSPVAILLIWQAASAAGVLSERVLPAPSLILDAGWQLTTSGELAHALAVSGTRVVQGLLLGGIIGVLLGTVVGLSRFAEATVDPPLQMLRALPHLGLIPLFILWFGIGETPKILLVALGVAFPLYLNTFSAIRQIDRKFLDTAVVLGFSWWQRFTVIIAPSIAPQLLVGLRQSLAIAWLSLIVAEQINAESGLGYIINNARDFLRIDVIIFGLVVYALMGIATDGIVRILEKRSLRYRSEA
ncbi:ABC transporter permease [Rhodococcoides corynebacterioides]|uniref:ABC transporter permease n=1 Tax=Rhodococcoides corynebacterioides TaxID=53972 RepID=UPI001C9B47CE|nr:ABC transporter permease [Rhodococcus corynebacterioides]MBY6350847.1 ABC transporter permease [Rhodococcus corynebacterioides]